MSEADQNQSPPLIRTVGLTKQFPQVLANDEVTFEVRRGEIHCLLGENGAGKTTLAEMLYGAYKPDSGGIYFKGQLVAHSSPREAIDLGIGMVHQHFVLIPPLSVVENIVVGTESAGLLLDLESARKRLEELSSTYKVEIDLNAKIWQLSVGEQQWVEILKALYGGVELLILDEPTAVLTPQESEKLFAILRQMRLDGLSIIFITHKLKEVMEVSDRVTVLRRGRLVDTVNTAEVTKESLAEMMVGRQVVFQIDKEEQEAGAPLLVVDGLQAQNDKELEALRGVSFTAHMSEILGVAGVSGNGQSELFDVLVGVRKATGGKVTLDGTDLTNQSPAYIARQGVASIPEDRVQQGLVMEFKVGENIILGRHRSPPFARGGIFVNEGAIRHFAREMIDSYDIATPSENQTTKVLSGGNLQKVILARELSVEPKLMIVSQPTRGLDVGATESVHRRILEQRDLGVAVLLISDDLDEIINLSTRIAVMFKGQIIALINEGEATRDEIGLMMAGIQETGE